MKPTNTSLFQALTAYTQTDSYPFHMPGHKRQTFLSDDPFHPESIDITEITGFDNLHDANGILKDAQERMARVFGAYKSFFLVNGSTAGILAAISACTKKNGRILMARNCHKSVYHAAMLQELTIDYLEPPITEWGFAGSISPESIASALTTGYDAVIITSPTYDGIVSDIKAIADAVHAHNIPLIVDEAHGAHLGFSDMFPQKAISLGADIVIESLHKTLPAFTQSAALHIADSPFIDENRIRRYLTIFQTSSPSYILMAGIDRCVELLETQSSQLFSEYEKRLADFYDEAASLRHISVFCAQNPFHTSEQPGKSDPASAIFEKDPSKILISADALGLTGYDLFAILRDEYYLELEMASSRYATALTSVMDTDEGFNRLTNALKEIDQRAISSPAIQKSLTNEPQSPGLPVKAMEIHAALGHPQERIPLSQADGRISAAFLTPYPPGIPIVVPGEVIRAEDIQSLLRDPAFLPSTIIDITTQTAKING